ncbi:class I SAM-dependent methyltransferase [Candidatus Woesearchaeota archaeon]|nr:class I SAM-dependent methyltransferase [Candidatus Woesearchaeota archaeon]
MAFLTNVDKKRKYRKAEKIIRILRKFVDDLSKCNVLDIGTGSGYISEYFCKRCYKQYSVDIDDLRLTKKGYKFAKYGGRLLPFPNNKFDVVISNGVIEHVKDQKKHLDEIYRVLKKNGIAYICTPNKYWFIDGHTHLPFITYLPHKLADRYMKIMKAEFSLFTDGNWGVRALSYNKLKRMSNKFAFTDMTANIMKNPDKYGLKDYMAFHLTKYLPLPILRLLKYISPTFVVVLRK